MSFDRRRFEKTAEMGQRFLAAAGGRLAEAPRTEVGVGA